MSQRARSRNDFSLNWGSSTQQHSGSHGGKLRKHQGKSVVNLQLGEGADASEALIEIRKLLLLFLTAAMANEQSDEKNFCSTISLSGVFQPLKELGSHVLDLLSTSIQVHRETNLRDLN